MYLQLGCCLQDCTSYEDDFDIMSISADQHLLSLHISLDVIVHVEYSNIDGSN